jgi:spore maturation protein CgeB
MKITVFYPQSQGTAWSMQEGIARTLRFMGHEVLTGITPVDKSATEQRLEAVRKQLPPIQEVQTCDLVIVSGPEHIGPWLQAVYGAYEWKNLGVPKAAWLHESCHRDYDIQFDGIKVFGDHFFFPAIQDAEFHDQEPFAAERSHWLPLGVDTDVFSPDRGPHDHNVGFIGLLYERRQKYLMGLARHHIPPIRVGQVMIQDINGFDALGSALRLAASYSRIKVFLNLPAMSGMLVSKVYEVMACRTFLLSPELSPEQGPDNMRLFESGKHLIYYRPSNLPYLAQLLTEWSSPEKHDEREAIALAGMTEVREKHSLELRMQQMFAFMGLDSKIRVETVAQAAN